jgi:hypothetical protein
MKFKNPEAPAVKAGGRKGLEEEMIGDVSERVILATLVSIIILAFVFVSVAWTCPECMPWHRPDARHILW